MWIAAHERAIEEAMEADPELTWDDAYNSDAVAKRADVLCADHWAAMVDEARDRSKYERMR
jgi:ornithine carbamoyltransferase